MIYKLTLALALAAITSAKLFKEDPEHQKFLWESFKRDFAKRYETMDEEMHRFKVFVQNLRDADSRNTEELAAGGNAVHGITRFSDLSQAEFEARYLTANPKDKTENRTYDTTVRTVNTAAGLVDWTGTYTTPVKDQVSFPFFLFSFPDWSFCFQGYCGSCWAFSATEQIESDSMRTLGTSYVLSPAQITQCDTTSYGCDGGWTENAYDYVKKAGGIEQEKDYEYSTALYKGIVLSSFPSFVIVY
jgi:cathepsin F